MPKTIRRRIILSSRKNLRTYLTTPSQVVQIIVDIMVLLTSNYFIFRFQSWGNHQKDNSKPHSAAPSSETPANRSTTRTGCHHSDIPTPQEYLWGVFLSWHSEIAVKIVGRNEYKPTRAILQTIHTFTTISTYFIVGQTADVSCSQTSNSYVCEFKTNLVCDNIWREGQRTLRTMSSSPLCRWRLRMMRQCLIVQGCTNEL